MDPLNLLSRYLVGHSFCPTGPGGGVDPRCSPGGTSASGTISKDEVIGKVRALFLETGRAHNGGECGAVAYTLQHLNPKFKVYGLITRPPAYGGEEGVAHVLVSEDGKTFYDGRGAPLSKAMVLKGASKSDKPEIVEMTYVKDPKTVAGGYYRTPTGAEQDAGLWKDFEKKLREAKPVYNTLQFGNLFDT